MSLKPVDPFIPATIKPLLLMLKPIASIRLITSNSRDVLSTQSSLAGSYSQTSLAFDPRPVAIYPLPSITKVAALVL